MFFDICIEIVIIFIPSITTITQTNLYFMEQFTEQILPILFIGLVTYFIGSVARLFIHLLINEHANG